MSISNKTLAIIGGAAALIIVPAGVSFGVAEATLGGHAAIHAPGFPGNGEARVHAGRGEGARGNVGPGMMGRQGRSGAQQGARPHLGLRGGQSGAPGAPQAPNPAPSTSSTN